MKTMKLFLFSAGSFMPLALLAQNLFVNPGFEEGTHNDAPPWGVGGWRGSLRAVTADKHSGRRSILLQGGGDEGGINSVMQIVPIDPTGATQYTLSAWVKLTSSVSATSPGRTRVRWYFDQGANGAANYPEIANNNWNQYDSGAPIIPPAGATMLAYRQYVYATHPGQEAAYVDDMQVVPSPSGAATYPGVKGVVKNQAGVPVAGAVVFLKNSSPAQEFASSYAITDSAGNYAVCTTDDGDYYVVAWKQGHSFSEEKLLTLATGSLATFNPVVTNANGGRNLAISTAGRSTTAVAIPVGNYDDPQYSPVVNLFDGNTISTRYANNVAADPANDRWAYIDLDPVGHGTFSINEFVLRGYGVTLMTMGAEIGLPTDFAIEYTTNDPATETEAGWTSHVAYSVSGAPASRAPVVIRLSAPITARAVRLHVTGGSFGPVNFEVNSATLPRGVIQGVVKDATTGLPIAGARVARFFPNKIQNDTDIYGLGNEVPYVVKTEELIGTPYEYATGKNTEQTVVTDANGNYSLTVDPGLPVRVTAMVDGYPYATFTVTPPENGTPATQDFSLAKGYVLSGVVKSAGGPINNAIVQVGGAASKTVVVTGTDGTYNVVVGAGTREIYADAYGYAGNVQSVNITADTIKDITLTAAAETDGVNANFDANVTGWQISRYDTNWQTIGSAEAAVRDTTQNLTPGGSGSALVEDKMAYAADNTTELAYGYRMLERAAASRIPVQAGKTYNVYCHIKAGNWVTTGNGNGRMDTVHYEIVWRNAAGAVIDRNFSHPYWIYPQPSWATCDVGHPEGKDDSATQARLTPPAGAATLDIRVGWLRNSSNPDPNTGDPRNPPGTQLFVDDLVVDAFASAPPTITMTRQGGQIIINYTGTLESSANVGSGFAPVVGAPNPFVVTPDQAQRFYRTSQ